MATQYQEDINGIYVWNPAPAAEETAQWAGQVKDGYADGDGRLSWYWRGREISVYRGRMQAGKPEGYGRYLFADGDIYEGEWKSGLRHGFGQQWFRNGAYYEGMWHDDMRNGE